MYISVSLCLLGSRVFYKLQMMSKLKRKVLELKL